MGITDDESSDEETTESSEISKDPRNQRIIDADLMPLHSEHRNLKNHQRVNRRKKRKINASPQNGKKMETRKWRREIIAQWMEGQYVAAIRMAEKRGMEESEINELIEYLYATGL